MKIVESRTYRVLALCAVLVAAASACGYLVSVPTLRNADNDEIVNIGDSIFALTGDIYDDLHAKAGETWRHYAVSGAQMVGGILAPPVPLQYRMARSDDPDIRVVYMDGGGNDVLLQAIAGDPYRCKQCNYWWCGGLSRSCKDLIDDAYVAGEDLLLQMEADGVEQVVFLGYYYPTLGIFGDLRTLRKATDYASEQAMAGIEALGGGRVVFVDPRPVFRSRERSYIMIDGIHPTRAGSRVLADMIWDVIDY